MNLPPMLAHVALSVDLPEHGLTRGETGTVEEYLGNDEAVLVEFSDDHGETYAMADLLPEQDIALHRRRAAQYRSSRTVFQLYLP